MSTDITLACFPETAVDLEIRSDGARGRFSRAAPPADPIDPPEATGDTSLIISANRTSGVGPAGFQLRAVPTGFATTTPEADLQFKWDFGDPGSVFKHLDPEMPWGVSANEAFGFWAAHTYAPSAADFAAAGGGSITYTVRCTVTDGTDTATATLDIRVDDPDVFYAGNKTLLISPSGAFPGAAAYPGAVLYTDLDQAMSDIYRKTGKDYRVLLEAGQQFYPSDSKFSNRHFQLGYFGDLSLGYPVWNSRTVDFRYDRAGDVTVFGVKIKGGYNPTTVTPTSNIPSASGLNLFGKNMPDTYVTVHDVEISGYFKLIDLEGYVYNVVISDFYGTDWYDYGVQEGNVVWFAMVGCKVVQNPLTKNYDGKYSTPYANHGPLRVSRLRAGPIILNNCDFASFNNWSMSPGANYSVQPCTRVNNGGEENITEVSITQMRTCGEQAGLPVTTLGTASFPMLAVVDKLYHIRWGQGSIMISSSFGGTTFKNCVLVNPDIPWGNGRMALVECGYQNRGDFAANYETYLGPDYPIKFQGITVAKLQSGSNINVNANPLIPLWNKDNNNFPRAQKGFNPDAIFINGLLWYAPEWGETPPLDVTGTHDPYPAGKREGEQPLDATYAIQRSDTPLCRPTAPIPLDPGDIAPVDDFFGTLRGANPSKGAVEPL